MYRVVGIASLAVIVLLNGCVGQPTTIDRRAEVGAAVDAELVRSALTSLDEHCGIRFEGQQLPDIRFELLKPDAQSTASDFLLLRFLGFVANDLETYRKFSASAADQRSGSYSVATNTVSLRPELKSAPANVVRVTLLHELTHSWHLQASPSIAESLGMGMQHDPDRYFTALAIAEGFAIACMDAWRNSGLDGGFNNNDLRSEASEYSHGEINDDWSVPSANADTAALSQFHRRSQQWVYGLGSSYSSNALRQFDTDLVGDLASIELPMSTAELLNYKTSSQCERDCRSLGALLTREMLIWSGLDWRNADAVSSSVLEDTLEWADDGEGSTCAALSIVYRELNDVHPRSLGVGGALRRWAAINGHSITADEIDTDDNNRSILVAEHCYSSDALHKISTAQNRAMPRYVDSARERRALDVERYEYDGAMLVPDVGGSVIDSLVQAAGHQESSDDVKAMLSAMAEHPETFVGPLPGEEPQWLRADAENALRTLDSTDSARLRPRAPHPADDPLSFTIRREWL